MMEIEAVRARAYTIPTDAPESDGTLAWDATTIVVVEVSAGGVTGLGYSYTHAAAAGLIESRLAHLVRNRGVLEIKGCWDAMRAAVRNVGSRGIAAAAISAVDVALWDLKARVLELPLVDLLGGVRAAAPIYGSGGFTSYTIDRLQEQLGRWVGEGIPRVKMKVGRHPDEDLDRVRAARAAIGDGAELFVDADGAYRRKQALALAGLFRDLGVTWFEEPVSSDDLAGLRLIRDAAPAGMDITAGEYGFGPFYFRRLLAAGAVDVLQADVTRCLGITGFFHVAALCESEPIPLSAHTAPAIHLHLACALTPVIHLEYFWDHARIENLLFEGSARPQGGTLTPDRARHGLGLELRRVEAARYAQ